LLQAKQEHTETPNPGDESTARPNLTSRVITASPIYYGWVIVFAGIVGRLMTSPGQTYTISIFIEHFIRDLGVSRSMVSTLYTIGTMTAALSLPFVGRQLDRRGPRFIVGVVSVLFALACVYMSTIQNAFMLGIGFVLLRTLGQGALGMVSGNIINQWWVRRRGTILGMAGVVTALLGNGMFPSLAHGLIGAYGWRSSYLMLGGMLAAIMVPMGLLLYRWQPEAYGLKPDAGKAKESTIGNDEPLEENWTRAEALRAPSFWIIALGLSSIAMLSTGLQFHMVSIFADSGLSEAAAATAYLPLSATLAVVMLLSGILLDRVPVRYLLFAALIGQTLSLLAAPRLTGQATALAYGIVLGATGGLQNMVGQVVWANYFGRKHLGAIMGVSSLVTIAGSSLGPLPMGIARDAMGSYQWALTVSAILPFALAILALFAKRPQREPAIEV